MRRRLCLWFGAFRNVSAFLCRVDRDRGNRTFSTLTCHFLIPALCVCSLAIGMIEHSGAALLVFAVGLAALLQSRRMTMIIRAVALPVIAPAAYEEHRTASRKSTRSPAYLDWQGGRAFPRRGSTTGTDNGRLWIVRYGGPLIGTAVLGLSRWLRLGPFLFAPLEENKPTERERPHLAEGELECQSSLTMRIGGLAG